MAKPRQVALQALLACERQGAWSDGYLRSAIRKAVLSGRDAALCTRLTYGVLQNRMLLDWYVEQYCSVPGEKLEPAVRNSLRLGIYQLLFFDRVPAHAAINESVELSKKNSRNPRSGALTNGVLRTVQRQLEGGSLPQPEDLSIRYSHPQWLVELFSQLLPSEEVEQLLQADNGQPPVCAQVNTEKTTTPQLREELTAAGVEVQEHPWLPDCLLLEGTGALEELPAFQEGRFYIQDAAAKLAVLAAGVQPGMAVLDACAAPGGKSFAAGIQMKNQGEIISCDIHPHKEKLIRSGAQRLGLELITAQTKNAKEPDPAWAERFDTVIADVPCSGLGIIRKKPDIRYKDPAPLAGLVPIQGEILRNVAAYVKPGGVLLYATCTLLPRENEQVVEQFLTENSTFSLEPVDLPGPIDGERGMVTLWPHRQDTDGFFFAKLRKH